MTRVGGGSLIKGVAELLFNPKKKIQNRLLVLSIFFLLSFFLLEVGGSYEGQGAASSCLECHKEAFDEDLARGLVHQPCLEKRCIICHCPVSADITGDHAQAQSTGPVSPVPAVPETQTEDYELTVIDATLQSDFSHSFLFSDDKVENVLLVELWQGKERQKVERVALLPLEQLPRLVDDKQPPQLSEIKVEKVERGPFSSAVITWKTDKPATSGICYGVTELNHNSVPSGCLIRNHRVTLSSLKTNRKYQFFVVSNDLFGNQAVSDCRVLSTEGDDKVVSEPESLPESRDYSIIGKQFFNVDGRYLALFELSQSLSLSIGVEDPQGQVGRLPDSFMSSAPESEKGTTIPAEDEEVEHCSLLSEVETTIDICFTCHKGIRKDMSHPIDVLPSPGMQVPNEYPLLSSGKLSCMTCHVRHGGDNLYRLVRVQGKQFCEGCHAAY